MKNIEVDSVFLQLVRDIEQRFTSGNDVQVPDIRLTRDEWQIIMQKVWREI